MGDNQNQLTIEDCEIILLMFQGRRFIPTVFGLRYALMSMNKPYLSAPIEQQFAIIAANIQDLANKKMINLIEWFLLYDTIITVDTSTLPPEMVSQVTDSIKFVVDQLSVHDELTNLYQKNKLGFMKIKSSLTNRNYETSVQCIKMKDTFIFDSVKFGNAYFGQLSDAPNDG